MYLTFLLNIINGIFWPALIVASLLIWFVVDYQTFSILSSRPFYGQYKISALYVHPGCDQDALGCDWVSAFWLHLLSTVIIDTMLDNLLIKHFLRKEGGRLKKKKIKQGKNAMKTNSVTE